MMNGTYYGLCQSEGVKAAHQEPKDIDVNILDMGSNTLIRFDLPRVYNCLVKWDITNSII